VRRVSPRRRVHVGAVIFYAAFLYIFSPMNLLVIGWFADFEDAISHRVHEVSIGALFTLGFAGVLAQLRRSDRTTGAVQAVVALAVAAGVITTIDVVRAAKEQLRTDRSPRSLLKDVKAEPIAQSNLVAVTAKGSSAVSAPAACAPSRSIPG